MFNVYYGKAPMIIQALFITNDAIHDYSTRRNNQFCTSMSNFIYLGGGRLLNCAIVIIIIY